MSRRTGAVLLVFALAATAGGLLAQRLLRQGFDPDRQGLELLAAAQVLDGRAPHATLDTGQSPFGAHVLALWMRGRGLQAGAWSQNEALWFGLAWAFGAALLWFGPAAPRAGSRRVPWLVLWGAALFAALPTGPAPAATAAGLWLLNGRRGTSVWPDRLLGAMSFFTFTLDPVSGLALSIPVFVSHTGRREALRGLAAAGAIGFVLAIASGAAADVVRNSILMPVSAWGTRLAQARGILGLWPSEPGASAWLRAAWTGEAAGTLPHTPILWIAVTRGLLALGVVGTVATTLAALRRSRAASTTAAAALGAMALLLVIGAQGPRDYALATGWACVALALGRPAAGVPRPVWIALLVLAPALAENLWGVARADRATLVDWDVARGHGVRLAPARADQWRRLLDALRFSERSQQRGEAARQPTEMLAWQHKAGAIFLAGARPASRWMQAPRGGDADRRLLADLGGRGPRLVVLPDADALTVQELQARLPLTTEELRRSFRLRGVLAIGAESLRLLSPEVPGETPRLTARLPRLEMGPGNDVAPAMHKGLSVGQSFRLEGEDLEGFALRWSTRGHDIRARLRARVWQRRGDDFDTLLAARTVEVLIEGDGNWSVLRYPLERTAGLELAITVELLEPTPAEIRLRWCAPSGPGAPGDPLPGGSALLDREPVAADLEMRIY